MTSKKAFSIITIACFVSVLFIPIGLVLMFFYTDWKKKIKIILSSVLTILYAILIIFILNLQPNPKTGSINLPIPVDNDFTDVQVSTNKIDEKIELKPNDESSNKEDENSQQMPAERLPKTLSRKNNFFKSRSFYSLLFILFMIFLIIHQNLKSSKKKQNYENPYVDTEKYKLPLQADSQLPLVHFLKIRLKAGEKILYASPTTKKEDEGDFVVTNQRVVVLSKEADYEFPLHALTAVSSISSNVMLLTCGERKYYIFFPEGQLKYALALVRWAYSNQ
ncbi:MAG: hypothetical protein K5866_03180 [Treponema sp.]|nr:hypothetical protein [Treponema sp.]